MPTTIQQTVDCLCCTTVWTPLCPHVPLDLPVNVHLANCLCFASPFQYTVSYNGQSWVGGGSFGGCGQQISIRITPLDDHWQLDAAFSDNCGGWTGFTAIGAAFIFDCDALVFNLFLPEIPDCCDSISNGCCPAGVPLQMFISVTNTDCSCAGSFSFPINSSDGIVWTGSQSIPACGLYAVTVTLICGTDGGGNPLWEWDVNISGCVNLPPVQTSPGCPPFGFIVCLPGMCGCGPNGELQLTVTG